MGSYDVCCSVSNVTINCGDPAVYIPLESYKYREGNIPSDGNNMLIYPGCFYTPATLPIFGEYDDYGRIGYIEKNQNTEILEVFFDTKIEDICDLHGNKSLTNIISGMFVHRSIFESLIKAGQVDEFGKKTSPINGAKGDMITHLSSDFDMFIKQMNKGSEMYKKMIKDTKDLMKKTGENDDISHLLSTEIFTSGIYSVFKFREYSKNFHTIYQPHILNGELKEEMIQFVMFEGGLHACNRFYFPAMNGYQHGNHFASKILADTSVKILRENIKKYKEQEREWKVRLKQK